VKIRLLFFTIIFIYCSAIKSAVSSPQVTCVSVLANGDVSISWLTPTDPLNEFQSYSVYTSANINGNYTLAGTVLNYTTSTFTHTGANANNVPRFYYITTKNNNNSESLPLDTVRTIFLVINPSNGIATLQWNPISIPLPASSSNTYSIYREYPAGNFSLLGITTDLRWKDTISVCNFFFNYRIEIADANNCVSVSNVEGALIGDLTPPLQPKIDSVSINANNQTIIGLSPSLSDDATCYVVYKKQGFSFIAIDTVCGNVPVLYLNIASSPTTDFETYSIASIDSCGNISTIGLSQNTLFLRHTYDLCSRRVNLGWNPYINMKNNIGRYEIYYSENGGPFQYSGFTTQTNYIQNNLNTNSNYSFFVRAVNSNNTASSTSNKINFLAKSQPVPQFAYVKYVSVTANEDIEIGVKADSLNFFSGIEIYKATNTTDTFIYLGYMNRNTLGNYSYIDYNVNPDVDTYFYKVIIIDSCRLKSVEAGYSNSVVLKAKSNPNRTNTLTWSTYATYLGDVEKFNIYRSVNDVFDAAPVASVDGAIRTFTDDISELTDYQGKFGYYVQAVEGDGNPYFLKELSNSNRVITYHEDSIFIPNAFVPKGLNNVFMPVTQFVEKTEYKMSIYDRWGQLIFTSLDENIGWSGDEYPDGLYAYVVEFKNAFGTYRQYTGTVLLIR
jgi:hypothetical protein